MLPRPDAPPEPNAAVPAHDRVPNLPAAGGARARALVARALARHCPYCGGSGIFAGWFTLRETCPHCGVRFEKEDGYFLGGYALNLVGAEIVGLGLAVWVIFFTAFRNAPLLAQETLAISLAALLPILFFPYSRTIWMALDLFFTPASRQFDAPLRTGDMRRGGPDRPEAS